MGYEIASIDDKYYELLLSTFRKVKKVVSAQRALNVSQVEIADRIGMDEGQFSRLLSGRSNVTLRTLNRIARAAGARLEIDVVPLAEVPKRNVPSVLQESERWIGFISTGSSNVRTERKVMGSPNTSTYQTTVLSKEAVDA